METMKFGFQIEFGQIDLEVGLLLRYYVEYMNGKRCLLKEVFGRLEDFVFTETIIVILILSQVAFLV